MADKSKNSQENEDNNFEQDLKRLENFLERGIDQISAIETDESIKANFSEQLENIISKEIKIERSEYSAAKRVGNLIFEDNIQFFIDNHSKNISDIQLEDIELIKEVKDGQLMATVQIDNQDCSIEFINKDYDSSYQELAGIQLKQNQNKVCVYSTRSGKVVVFHSKIYIIPLCRDAKCIVYISQDKMEAKADLIPSIGNGKKLTKSMVLEEFEKQGVKKGININNIEKLIEEVNNNNVVCKDVVLAQGQQPYHGKDASITFYFPVETPKIDFKILPDGRIDYKKQAPIKMVKEGELLATVGEPQQGINGFCVTGEILEAKSGSSDVLFAGENVRVDGKKYYATCNGMISLNDKILSVLPHYCVNGDVDLKCGNINFNGSVTVLGTVRTGFEVKASGDIFVSGSVEAANIEAGRDMRVNIAIIGANVKAGRNIFAGHVQNATLEAEGDIDVVKSIMHSNVFSSSKITLHDKKGTIVGGLVIALKGINAMSIGSYLGTPTTIEVGSDYLVKKKKEELNKLIDFYEKNLKKLDDVLKPIMVMINKGIPLSSEKKKRLSLILEKRKSIENILKTLKGKMNSLIEISSFYLDAYVLVEEILYPDVTIKMVDLTLHNREEKKTIKIKYNKVNKEIEISPLHKK